jgi:hypothetical protein
VMTGGREREVEKKRIVGFPCLALPCLALPGMVEIYTYP